MSHWTPDPSRVAIIVPTFNRAHSVGRAIDSALSQSYPAIRVIVVDDGSSDATLAALEAYIPDSRVTLVRHPENRGASAAKSTGLARLEPGDTYFGILDSDDTLEPGAVATLVNAFGGGDYSMTFGWCQAIPHGGATGEMHHRTGAITYDDALTGRFSGEFWQLCRTELLGDLRFDDRAIGGEASVWWPLLRVKPAWLVPDVVRKYEVSGLDRVSVLRYTTKDARGRMFAYQGIADAVGRDLRAIDPRRYGMLLGEVAKWAALAGDHRRAIAASSQALRLAPGRRSLALLGSAMLPARLVRSLHASYVRGDS